MYSSTASFSGLDEPPGCVNMELNTTPKPMLLYLTMCSCVPLNSSEKTSEP